LKYRTEIDGLRALAVVPVILFHAGFELFSGGFVGVDVFFVISGYLITTILIEDIENKKFSIVNFYERRARRILPALFFVMLVCIPFAWVWMLPNQMKDFSQSLVAVSLFASNILFWKESGYFDLAAEEKPLLHTWSLAVEEQYYILFPIFLILAWRFGKNRVFWMIVVMAAISLLLSEWGWRNKATANFYLAPTRAWELFAGSITAFIFQKKGFQKNNLLATCGLAAIVFSIFFYDETTPFPSVYALVPVLGVVLLLLYADKETLAAKLLSTKGFVGIGLISYSAYLWHQPLFAFARIKSASEPSQLIMSILALTSLLLAYLSWKYIETPFRNKKNITRTNVLFVSFFGLVSFIILGGFGHLKNGFDNRLTTEQLDLLAFSTHYKGRREAEYWNLSNKCYIISLPFNEFEKRDCFTQKFDDASLTVLLIGDSHSGYLSEGLRPYLELRNINLLQLSISHCASLAKAKDVRCNESLKTIKTIVKEQHVDAVVEFHTAGMEIFSDNPENYFEEYISNLMHISENVSKVYIVGQIPTYFPSLPSRLMLSKSNLNSDRIALTAVSEESKNAERHLKNLLDNHDLNNVEYISLFDELCNENSCLIRVGGSAVENLINWDYGHLSENGAKYISEKLVGKRILMDFALE
jgi:peptidoglycan/LPS O-acetylase OafA/YrhL